MVITAPTTSTSLVDVLSEAQKTAIMEEKKYQKSPKIRIETHGGTLWWTAIDDTAVIDECASINDGDIEFIELNKTVDLEEMQIIADSGVTCNIEIV